tara:strand:+ start:962 stop:1096 length:135 start_codon:yes stop_codon:yes gene_type:complete
MIGIDGTDALLRQSSLEKKICQNFPLAGNWWFGPIFALLEISDI